MQKDYYKILQLPPGATLAQVKEAYRRLAMIYHPDKNFGDPSKETQFGDIKEAYEVLVNPAKKEIYLQERWYNQSILNKKTIEPITPVSILRLSLELEKYVSTVDPHRMNKEGLFNYIRELLSADTIEKLKQFNEKGVDRQIVVTILSAIEPLPLKFLNQLLQLLETLAEHDDQTLLTIKNFSGRHKRTFLWDKYKIALILLFTILICLLIYFTGK